MSSFTPVTSFSGNEIGDVDKLNAVVANQNILYSMVPTFLYRRANQFINFDEGQAAVFKPVIYAGRIVGRSSGGRMISQQVPFPAGTFAASCAPVINVTLAPETGDRRAFVSIGHYSNGLSRIPGPEGFSFRVFEEDNRVIQRNMSIHFVAHGYQEA